MDMVGICELDCNKIMYVCWEALETCLISHKAMDIDQKQRPLVIP